MPVMRVDKILKLANLMLQMQCLGFEVVQMSAWSMGQYVLGQSVQRRSLTMERLLHVVDLSVDFILETHVAKVPAGDCLTRLKAESGMLILLSDRQE